MHIPSATCSLLALASLASCRALNLRPRRAMFDRDFDIPSLQTHASSGLNGTDSKITITFQFHDQNTQTSSTCNATFPPSRTENGTTQNFFPTRRTACSPDPYFGWSFERFDGIESFALALSHTYRDPSVGDPPWDRISTFGSVNISAAEGSDYECKADGTFCSIPEGKGPIPVPITAAIS